MKNVFLILLVVLIVISCSDNFEVIEDLGHSDFELINQDSNNVSFPNNVKGSIAVVGYIFTNCPDICPLTTNNMRLVQEKLKKENIRDVKFVSISFDPETDKPSVLKSFAKVRSLDLNNWEFLTGNKTTIDNLLKRVGVLAFKSDSTTFSDGHKQYYYTHTDRIQLIDEEGRIVKNYLGSKLDINEIVENIKKLD